MQGKPLSFKRLKIISSRLATGTPRAITRAIDVLRTAIWFERLLPRTQKLTAYAVGKQLQSETYRKGENGPFSHNLWPKYARGAVTPSRTLLNAVDKKLPGSLADFDHIVFDVMDPSFAAAMEGDALFKRMHAGVQMAIFEARFLRSGTYRRRRSLERMLDKLEGEGHLDALAGAIVLLREAHDSGDGQSAFQIGLSVYRLMLICCSIGAGAAISMELISVIMRLVLSQASYLRREFDQDAELASLQCTALSRTLHELVDRDQIGRAPSERRKAAFGILRGNFGHAAAWALLPKINLQGPEGEVPAESALYVLRNEDMRARAHRGF